MEVTWLDRTENWTQVEPVIRRLIEHEHRHGMTLSALAQRIASGQYKVWLLYGEGVLSGFFMTAMYAQQNGRLVCSLSWCAGEDVIHPDVVLPRIERYARDNGCFAIEVMGRRGWERVLRGEGFEHFYTGLIKELA